MVKNAKVNIESALSLNMEFGHPKLQNIMDDGLSTDLMNAGRFCFSCEQIFSSRKCMEEHICPSASYICSCGTEFKVYKDMLVHSTTHEPGHQVLDHQTIKKRRIEKHKEEEEQLKRLQSGEVVWESPKGNKLSGISLPTKTPPQTILPQLPRQPLPISQVPEMYPYGAPVGVTPNPRSTAVAPTVDLWTLFQPVVLMRTMRKFNTSKPYTCGKCGQCFMTKMALISHHSCHVADKVSGCIGCGLLLSSRKLVPRFHTCNSPGGATKFKLITAKPLSAMKPVGVNLNNSQNQSAQSQPITPSPLLQSQNRSVASKSITPFDGTLNQQFKHLNSGSFAHASLPAQTKSPSSVVYTKNSKGRLGAPYSQLMSSMRVSDILSKQRHGPSSYPCRVCHIHFDSAKGLQRHKCVKAQEFMAQHTQAGRLALPRPKQVTAVVSPAQMNGEQRFGAPTAASIIMKNQSGTVGMDRNKATAVIPDDDCYIVESGPDKPAEMIYQVTSSVPIKI